MKRSSTTLSLAFDARRANLPKIIVSVIVLSVVLGMILTDTTDEMVAYLLVTVVCALPIAVWIGTGAAGIPVMASFSAMCFVYYAMPILRKSAGDLSDFGSAEILSASVTVAIFVSTATFLWWLVLIVGKRGSQNVVREGITEWQIERFMFFGLALGAFYHVALYTGWLSWLGPLFGVARSAMLTAAIVACFMLGHARARGTLRGQKWAVAVVGLSAIVLLSWASLFLVNGLLFCLAAVFGFVITSRRLPWIFLSVAMVVIIVLHAGKDSMREKYWLEGKNYGEEISLSQVPAHMVEWVEEGLMSMDSDRSYSSVVDRASLLGLLARVQRLTPGYVPLLEGETYMLLPQMLTPRFIDTDKISSQGAMNLLNVHFGFLTSEGAESTAIGFGLIAEAYANFARVGVIGVAAVLGLIFGLIESWSAGAALVSLPSLVAVVAMMQFVNMETDAAGLVTTLFQSFAAIAISFWCLKSLAKHRRRLPPRVKMGL
jgi:hypothetical protein